MRYYIIIGITLILAILILFLDPYKDYLGVYNNIATVEYSQKEDGYEWILIPSNDNLLVEEVNNNKWTVKINKKGNTNVKATFINLNTNHVKYTIDYEFKNNGKKLFWLSGIGKGIENFNDFY